MFSAIRSLPARLCSLLVRSTPLFPLLLPSLVAAEPSRAALCVEISGMAKPRGTLVVRLFRRGDGAPRGSGFKERRVPVTGPRQSVALSDLAYGEYALFVFQDENDNGVLDHNFLRLPAEPIGFSNGFRVTVFSGIPDFDDLKFQFSKQAPVQQVILE